MKKNILIVGTGMFGVAMSQVLLDNGQNVFMLGKNNEIISKMYHGTHNGYPGTKLIPPTACFTSYYDAFKNNIEIIVLCIPSNAITSVYNEMKPYLKEDMTIVNTAKGLNPVDKDIWSKLFLTIDNKLLNYALLVGPSFAKEIVEKDKTIVNVVSKKHEIIQDMGKIFNNSYFKVIAFDNEYLASLVSSFKNALAVGFGLMNGFQTSFNTLSAYLVIGLKEIQLLVSTLTNNRDVQILDFFGVGDICLTCNSDESRNYQFGKKIAELGITKAKEEMRESTVEGYRTIQLINEFIEEYKLNCPMFKTIYQICYKEQQPQTFINEIWKKLD